MLKYWKISLLLILLPRNNNCTFLKRFVSFSSSSQTILSLSSSSSTTTSISTPISSTSQSSSSTSSTSTSSSFSLSSLFVNKDLPIRPSIDDVESISFGRKAKKRGVGSRGVPHRLNLEERAEFELAKKRKYLVLKGSGFREERGDSPLANTYRLYCDSFGIPAISIQKYTNANGSADELIIDYSPLRINQNLNELSQEIIKIANKYNEYIYNIEDTNIQILGFTNYEISLNDHAIWTIPVTGVKITFKDRKECKQLANELTTSFFNL